MKQIAKTAAQITVKAIERITPKSFWRSMVKCYCMSIVEVCEIVI